MLKISLLTIGDEILIGQIINSNASWIAEQCTRLGAKIILHSVVGDEREAMLSELDRLLFVSDVVLLTGGLGPTHDDITKSVLCEYFNDELIRNEQVLKLVEDFLQKRNIPVTERNQKQADVPKKAKILHNTNGTAPGLLFDMTGNVIVAMPGVPSEMKSIMRTWVLPYLESMMTENKEEVVLYKVLQTAGIAESKLADLLGNVDDFLGGGSLAFLPSYKGVRLRIGVTGNTSDLAREKLNQIEKHIYSKAGKFIFGENDDSLASVVGKLLKEKGKTCSVAESCTGGLLGAEFTSVPGSSDYFVGAAIVYSNEAKTKILDVSKGIIDAFGAVSEETAKELASNVRKVFKTDFGISITGIAGPSGGTIEKPVGTVWIGLASENDVLTKKFVFSNDREINRERSVAKALEMLLNTLKYPI